jgi:hypothetical protein
MATKEVGYVLSLGKDSITLDTTAMELESRGHAFFAADAATYADAVIV